MPCREAQRFAQDRGTPSQRIGRRNQFPQQSLYESGTEKLLHQHQCVPSAQLGKSKLLQGHVILYSTDMQDGHGQDSQGSLPPAFETAKSSAWAGPAGSRCQSRDVRPRQRQKLQAVSWIEAILRAASLVEQSLQCRML